MLPVAAVLIRLVERKKMGADTAVEERSGRSDQDVRGCSGRTGGRVKTSGSSDNGVGSTAAEYERTSGCSVTEVGQWHRPATLPTAMAAARATMCTRWPAGIQISPGKSAAGGTGFAASAQRRR